ncbi:MAG TPA: phosphoglucomutase (alpha-D-glucose-1,6-bisphosphate-dependent) [Vicinamibacterales bacterium]|nr:phosphoglucomutase (alpha-D-glucose-1,6-bisphosphate-dependent) [Vicinamibacterales bacterium]
MTIHPHAGQPAPKDQLIDPDALTHEYYERPIDATDPTQRVVFGTSGHRGSSLKGSFNEPHILAITQAICDYRRREGPSGPLYLGKDTHALSEPASRTALEVLVANRVDVVIDDRDGWTPTPVISHAILTYNHGRTSELADGIIVTPSHNPPEDGGIKYNPPTGGPAETGITQWIERRANELLSRGLSGVNRTSYEETRGADAIHAFDFVDSYVADLNAVVDMTAIRNAGLRIGVDPLGGSSVSVWQPIAERYGLEIDVVNEIVDPTFGFMPLDHDGRIRMDCSSTYAMANLIRLKDRFDVAIGNDPDADRHGIVTPGAGLMNPNHYLAAAIRYLFDHRPEWRGDAGIGKTVVTSSVIDRAASLIGRRLVETPVGFKWFVPGLLEGSLGFGGEESAGASFLRQGGTPWSTDKDGIVMGLLACELMARTGRSPSEMYKELTDQVGDSVYERIDTPVTEDQKSRLLKLSPSDITASTLAGDPIQTVLTTAPGNGASIGGLKVATTSGWFAARPSGTEAIYKLYAESFRGIDHLRRIQEEAGAIVSGALAGAAR